VNKFIFSGFEFNHETAVADFHYEFENGLTFKESFEFVYEGVKYDTEMLNNALFLAHILVGVSYYKTFPTSQVEIQSGEIDVWQANFFNQVFQEGLGQFAYENNLTRADLAHFAPMVNQTVKTAKPYDRQGIIALQSGGKDSLLLAQMLSQAGQDFAPWYVTNSGKYPQLLDDLGQPLKLARRHLDREQLKKADELGAMNGHVPVTYIIESLAIVQAILLGKNCVLAAIAHEGEEPHSMINDLPVNHQWSKTWIAEQNLARYVNDYLSPDLIIGSPLRKYSELRVAELFVEKAWEKYGHRFSSCNIANYQQGTDNSELKWCGDCAKCVNTWLLLAPFIPAKELIKLFMGYDLFARTDLTDIFKGLLDVGDIDKPFECVGEFDELRTAYYMAQKRAGYEKLSFDVPQSTFDYNFKFDCNMTLSTIFE